MTDQREPFDCPYCLAPVTIDTDDTDELDDPQVVQCPACLREVDVPQDDDFLAGVPLRASDSEEVLTTADLVVEAPARSVNALENEFDFSLASVDDLEVPDTQQDADQELPETSEREPSEQPEVQEDQKEDRGIGDRLKEDSKGGDGDLSRLLDSVDVGLEAEKGSFSIRCSVCDSRLLVTLMQVGKSIKCSDCFSVLKVRQPTDKEKRKIDKQNQLADKDQLADLADEDLELTLAPLEDDPINADDVGGEFEVIDEHESVTAVAELIDDDELALQPIQDESEEEFADVVFDDESDDEVGGESDTSDSAATEFSTDDLLLSSPLELAQKDAGLSEDMLIGRGDSKAGKRKPSQNSVADQKSEGRKGSVEDLKKTSVTKLNPYRSKSVQKAQKEKAYQPKRKGAPDGESPYPKNKFDAIFNAAVDVVTEPRCATRALVVAALLWLGNVVSTYAVSSFAAISSPTIADRGVMWAYRVAGWFPYAVGTLLLWYFCGVIFRHTTTGKKKIESWKLGARTEWASTLLITTFSFTIAGLPAMMLMSIYITAPTRLFLAVPFLASVWYSQSPFVIISSDVFGHLKKHTKTWSTVYSVVLAMASIVFVAGLLMHVPLVWVNVFTSALGAVFLSFATMAFAAVCGWHSGKVVEELG